MQEVAQGGGDGGGLGQTTANANEDVLVDVGVPVFQFATCRSCRNMADGKSNHQKSLNDS